jgi:hypothetical protein
VLNRRKKRSEMFARPKIARRVEWGARSAFLTAGAPLSGRNYVFFFFSLHNVKNVYRTKIKRQVGALMCANDLLKKIASITHFGALVKIL